MYKLSRVEINKIVSRNKMASYVTPSTSSDTNITNNFFKLKEALKL
jgi:hypothetical protein